MFKDVTAKEDAKLAKKHKALEEAADLVTIRRMVREDAALAKKHKALEEAADLAKNNA